MAITVFVYDDKLVEVTSSTVEFEEQDTSGTVLDIKTNSALTPGTREFGARLVAPAPPCSVVIWVDDTSGHYAATTVGTMHGGKPITTHVTLYALPSAASRVTTSSIAKNLTAAQTLIDKQVALSHWTREEAEAVRSQVRTVVWASLVPEPSPTFKVRTKRWKGSLAALGIRLTLPTRNIPNIFGGNIPDGLISVTAPDAISHSRSRIRGKSNLSGFQALRIAVEAVVAFTGSYGPDSWASSVSRIAGGLPPSEISTLERTAVADLSLKDFTRVHRSDWTASACYNMWHNEVVARTQVLWSQLNPHVPFPAEFSLSLDLDGDTSLGQLAARVILIWEE